MRFRRSNRDCSNCYGNGCMDCENTGRAAMSEDELGDYEDAQEARAEARAEQMAEDRHERGGE